MYRNNTYVVLTVYKLLLYAFHVNFWYVFTHVGSILRCNVLRFSFQDERKRTAKYSALPEMQSRSSCEGLHVILFTNLREQTMYSSHHIWSRRRLCRGRHAMRMAVGSRTVRNILTRWTTHRCLYMIPRTWYTYPLITA